MTDCNKKGKLFISIINLLLFWGLRSPLIIYTSTKNAFFERDCAEADLPLGKSKQLHGGPNYQGPHYTHKLHF